MGNKWDAKADELEEFNDEFMADVEDGNLSAAEYAIIESGLCQAIEVLREKSD